MKKKKDIAPLNDKNQRHGYWEVYYNDGALMYKCNFVNGKESGYEECYPFINDEIEIMFHL